MTYPPQYPQHPQSGGFPQPGYPGAGGPAGYPPMAPQQLIPTAPPPRSYQPYECAVPDINAQMRYAEAAASQ